MICEKCAVKFAHSVQGIYLRSRSEVIAPGTHAAMTPAAAEPGWWRLTAAEDCARPFWVGGAQDPEARELFV